MNQFNKQKAKIKAERLRRYLKGSIKQKDLAKILGITIQAVSYKIKNNAFSVEELIVIFAVLELSADEIGDLLCI